MRIIWTIAMKDLRVLLRQRVDTFFIFAFPVVYALFFTMVLSGGGGDQRSISIAVVDEDGTAGSRQFVERLTAEPILKVTPMAADEAQDAVRRGKQSAWVRIPAGFGEARESLFVSGGPRLELGVDPSRLAVSGVLQGLLHAIGGELMQDAMSDPDAMQRQLDAARGALLAGGGTMDADQRAALTNLLDSLDQLRASNDGTLPGPGSTGTGGNPFRPLQIDNVAVTRDRERTSPPTAAVTLPQGMAWGLLACAVAFGVSLVSERLRGTLVRLRTAPIGVTRILAGKGLACFLTILVVCGFMSMLGAWVFGVAPQNPLGLAATIICAGICYVGMMMLVAVIGRTESAASGIGWAVALVMAMLGGAMIPVFLMPGWMQAVAMASPVKWTILGFEGAIWRGFSVTELLLPCLVQVLIGVTFFAAGVAIFRIRRA